MMKKVGIRYRPPSNIGCFWNANKIASAGCRFEFGALDNL